MTDEQRKSLGIPKAVAKQQLLDDPQTHEIAQTLGVDVEDYVEQVLLYAMNPQLEAQVQVLDEQELEEMEVSVPSEGEVLNWFAKVSTGEEELPKEEEKGIKASDGFSTEKSKEETSREVVGGAVQRSAPTLPPPRKSAPESGPGAALKAELFRNQNLTNMAHEARRAQKPGKKR